MSVWPTSLIRNASGTGDLTVTVPVALSAVAVAPGSTQTPARLEAFLMLPMKLMFAATVAAVSGEPSEQVTPLADGERGAGRGAGPLCRQARLHRAGRREVDERVIQEVVGLLRDGQRRQLRVEVS